MSWKDVTNAILDELAPATLRAEPRYLTRLEDGADAMRRYAGEKRDTELGHPVSTLPDWTRITEKQRETWRRIFRNVLEKKRAEMAELKNGEVHSRQGEKGMCPQCGSKNVSALDNEEGITSYDQCNDCYAEWRRK